MGLFTVDGADLAFTLEGEAGAPVVQLHGLGSSRARDRELGWDLGAELTRVRLLRFDARGHGASTGRPDPEDYRWEHLGHDLLQLLDHCFPQERVHGIGVSMGCATLLHAAVAAPQCFASLSLVLPPTAWASRPPRAQTYLHAARLIERSGIEALLRVQRQLPVPPASGIGTDILPDVDPALLPAIYRGAAVSDLPDPAQLASLSVPVTILTWADDPAHPVSTAEALSEIFATSPPQIAHTPADRTHWPEIVRELVHRG